MGRPEGPSATKTDAVEEMNRAMGALRWEVDPSIWNDLDARYRALLSALREAEADRDRYREALAARDRAIRQAIEHVREHYDESIFPEPPKTRDGEFAFMARLTCDNVLREYEAFIADLEGAEVSNG